MSINIISLLDVTWPTTDVHKLMACLSTVELARLQVFSICQLNYGPPCLSPQTRIKIHHVQFESAITLGSLVALLSNIDVHVLKFFGELKKTSSIFIPPGEVSATIIAVILTICPLISTIVVFNLCYQPIKSQLLGMK